MGVYICQTNRLSLMNYVFYLSVNHTSQKMRKGKNNAKISQNFNTNYEQIHNFFLKKQCPYLTKN